MAKVSKTEKQLQVVTGVKPRKDEPENEYLLRLVQGVADLPEANWNKLGEPAQAWFNAAAEAVNNGQPVSVPSDPALPEPEAQTAPAEQAAGAVEKTKKARAPKKDVAGKGLRLLVEKNPKKTGSDAHKRFELYRTVKTVPEFLAQGGTMSDVRYDSARGYIELHDHDA